MRKLNPDFQLTADHVEKYQRQGFVVLKQFFSLEMIEFLKARVNDEFETPTDHYQKGFDKLRYDLCNGDETIFELLEEEMFQNVMLSLCQEDLFYTQGVGFSLKRSEPGKVNKGFTWHIESQSFGFNRAEDNGTTLWAPLHAIDSKKQRGGMCYVPRDIISGEFMYDFIDPAVFRCMDEHIKSGGIEFEDYVALRDDPLNSGGIARLLEYFSIEDDFELGDVILFDKYVLHRDAPLEAGPLEARDAFSLRFISADSRYDKERAEMIEIPRNYYGYEGPTKFHLEICKEDNELIVESAYFDADRERRFIRADANFYDNLKPNKLEEVA
ncbi:phytanoyl-CoA dioxygenase family protein [Pseudoalteromonas xiamenensis]|uniref:Phytanoyl-CoA dioxygenase family protein n=1 Tax=Pseudoalteromonas xiamenensis TaxID=882626 RepID=A0A975DLR1_9GAMM|nr:phytanoyl-CoA dioxygenase family protein [Pseudoalteromonas xiamenensis]QTH72741.1 phytanoyl-CoA dioxygenase family protein [Pseudoalteromonas xiamenensis]